MMVLMIKMAIIILWEYYYPHFTDKKKLKAQSIVPVPHREDLAKAGFTSSSTWLKGRTLPTQLHSATPLVAVQGQEPPENNRSVKFCRAELFIIVEDTHHCANYINCCPLWGQVGGLTTPSNVGNDAWACLYAENIWLFFFLNSFLWWPKTVIIGWIGWKLVALPCRGKVKPMNFALLQTLYWKQGRQDEGFWSICCNFLLAQEQVLSFPRSVWENLVSCLGPES